MAQSQTEVDDELLTLIDAPVSLKQRDDDVRGFVETALKNVREHLESNRKVARNMGHTGEPSVDDVLSPENVREIQVRAKPLENPRVTVWLKDCPHWANDAWEDYIYPKGLNAYNGKVNMTFDSREF